MTDTINKLLLGVAILAILGLVAVSIVKTAVPITVNTNPEQQRDTLTVSGTHQVQVAPDEAELTLQVQTQAPGAKEASTTNKELLTKVMSALRAQDIDAADIETTGVYLNRLTEWDYKTQRSVDRGYQQITTLKVTIKELDNVGSVLDAAVNAGANSVQDIQFTLRPETEARYKEQALNDAAEVARSKAQTLASAAGIKLGKVTSVSENNYQVIPYRYNTMSLAKGEADAAGAPTPISPEKVTMDVSVTIGYEIE